MNALKQDNTILVPESKFNPILEEAKGKIAAAETLAAITTPPTEIQIEEAAEHLKGLVKVRTAIDKARKEIKDFFLQKGKAIDAAAKEATAPVVALEEKLSAIKEYYIRIEQAKVDALRDERIKLLTPYCQTPEGGWLEDLGTMANDAFDALLTGYKYRAAQSAREIEKQKADAVELERLRKVEAEISKKPQSGIPHNAICFFQDGNKWCCVFGDFTNLQESLAGFGDTFDLAFSDLLKNKQGKENA